MNHSNPPIPVELAPCGIFCGACPSFNKTCLGCASRDTKQKRQSKWNCKLRTCCYDEKGLEFCSECEEYPCQKIKKKLLDSHPDDPRFNYRRDVPENLSLLEEIDQEEYLHKMKERYTCPSCGGQIVWYHYRCMECDTEILV